MVLLRGLGQVGLGRQVALGPGGVVHRRGEAESGVRLSPAGPSGPQASGCR